MALRARFQLLRPYLSPRDKILAQEARCLLQRPNLGFRVWILAPEAGSWPSTTQVLPLYLLSHIFQYNELQVYQSIATDGPQWSVTSSLAVEFKKKKTKRRRLPLNWCYFSTIWVKEVRFSPWESWNAYQKKKKRKMCKFSFLNFYIWIKNKGDTVKNTGKKPVKADHGTFGLF